MKMNAESLGTKAACVRLEPVFSLFLFSLTAERLFFSSTKDYHVFSFTAIRAPFVIMQMRKHAGNLIRAQI